MNKNELSKQEQQNNYKINDGRMMQGICTQWFQDTYPDTSLEELAIYVKIARHTFGYRKRDGYIEQSTFKLNPKTLKKYRDKLTKLGVISWQATKKFTLYRLLEPQIEINGFKLLNDKSILQINNHTAGGSIEKEQIIIYNKDDEI